MTQVLSPITARETTSIRTSQPVSLYLNTAFSPVDENGTFMMDKIYREGWLLQRTRKTKQWKKRWYVLRASVIGIYKNEKESKLYRQIDLDELSACSMLKNYKRPNVFVLFSPSRDYHLQAETSQDAQRWLSLISKNARIEETEEEFLMSPVVTNAQPIPILHSGTQPQSPTNRGLDGFTSSHTLEYSGTSMSSTSELGGMVSRSSLASPLAEVVPVAGPRSENATVTTGNVPALARRQSQTANTDTFVGVVRNESGLSSFEGQMSDSRVVWQGYLYVLKSKSGLRQWKKLWVVIRPRNIAFYKSDEEYRTLKLICIENVVNAVDIDPVSRSKKYCMQLILDDKSYKFAASSEESLMKWLGAFKSTIAKSRK